MTHAIQDGRAFYLFDHPDQDWPSEIVIAPNPVPDHDMEAAREARQWFELAYPDYKLGETK